MVAPLSTAMVGRVMPGPSRWAATIGGAFRSGKAQQNRSSLGRTDRADGFRGGNLTGRGAKGAVGAPVVPRCERAERADGPILQGGAGDRTAGGEAQGRPFRDVLRRADEPLFRPHIGRAVDEADAAGRRG